MSNKLIFHYTTIETLALILKNHTIRFTRLDKVDDIEESEFVSGPAKVRFGNYVFASCWTRSVEESITQWKLYAGYDGVRIALAEDDIFKSYDITPELANSQKSYFKPPFAVIGKDAICSPRLNPIKCEDIIYSDAPSVLAQETIADTGNFTIFSTTNAGIYKRKVWEFQKECRFKFTVFPLPESFIKDLNTVNFIEEIRLSALCLDCLMKKLPISQEFFDVALSDTALDNLQVMLGPRTTVAHETIVKALLNQYAPRAVLKHSELKLRK